MEQKLSMIDYDEWDCNRYGADCMKYQVEETNW